MKLIPFLRFGGSHHEEESEHEELEIPPNELIEPPAEEEETEETKNEEEKPEGEEEKKEEGEEKGSANDDEMLKMFMSVEEEFVDNSGLAAQLEDVPATELLEELRVLAPAFGVRVVSSEDEAV